MRFFCEKCRMFSKTRGFVFKDLLYVWDKNGVSLIILVWRMGVERAGVSTHCTRVSLITGSILCGLMGRIWHVLVFMNCEIWTARCNQGVISQPNRQICEMSAKFWVLLSLSKAHQLRPAPGTPAQQQAGSWEMTGWVPNILFKSMLPVIQQWWLLLGWFSLPLPFSKTFWFARDCKYWRDTS